MDFYFDNFTAAVSTNASCDMPPGIPNFDAQNYMGIWYEQTHTKGQWFEGDNITCAQAQYSGLQADGHFTVSNTNQDDVFGARTGVTGQGYCPSNDGLCFVHFGGPQPKHSNYKVVDTDYKTYSLVYACGPLKSYLWFLTRETICSDELYNSMLATAKVKLPNFNFKNLNTRNYQGPKCTYESPIASFFLQ